MSGVLRRNVGYLSSQAGAAAKNSSVVVKCVCIAVFCCYFLTFSHSAVQALTVTPGTLLPPRFHIWTAFTTVFMELHWWLVVIDLIVVGLCAKLIEPMWGALEMLVFFEVMNFSVVFMTVVIYFIGYYTTFHEELLFDTYIHGLTGYVAAVCVAVKQIMPDHVLFKIPVAGSIKFRNRNLPLLLLLGLLVVCSLHVTEWVYFWMFLSGTYAGFIYLRYLQKHSNGNRGDSSEAFEFATFFPNVLQPPVSKVVNIFHGVLVKLRILKKQQRKYNFAESLPSGISVTLPGSSQLDAERRKQIALKALNDRLSSPEIPAASAVPWPSLVDDIEEEKNARIVSETSELIKTLPSSAAEEQEQS
ncbi:transmembrane protein 115-like [Paramacrobiotus metropolitanus]|uniref:transmembrane protein 115-like n=1 Tax=Paramacrobiotus metropolitanus TaxID=2943436 RepID=UPI0024460E7F|nr:transmembrane protein 115-like [Paramacrobiotus metropolitanus]XP_055342777.1 transmembrane protein 115-like [Paramacrobiotus metropolitanus]XP_055342778.1 transmembrane protein 115-like [Paramacrobiotus metropolitanus]